MAATASSAAPVVKGGVAPLRAGQGYSFFLRRLHSLTGIIPVGRVSLRAHSDFKRHSHRRPGQLTPARCGFWRAFRWYFCSSCLASGCPSCFTRSTVSTSGIAAKRTSGNIPGPATGCTPRSAGPAASPSPTSSGTPARCVSPESICIEYPGASFGKVQAEVFQNAAVPVLRGGTDCRLVALRLRNLVVLREVGHHLGR